MPRIGVAISLMPGHNAVFRGSYWMDIPIYETEVKPVEKGLESFIALMKKGETRPDAVIVDWMEGKSRASPAPTD